MADADEMVNYDHAKLRRLRIAYAHAVQKRETQFSFDGKQLLVRYAKYLIEYLETELEGKH